MKLPTTKFDLSRLRTQGQANGLLVSFPSNATVRPGFLETMFASRAERETHRERDAAAAAVDCAQVQAAAEVAIARTLNVKEVALKSLSAETARTHHDLEAQMQKERHDADTVQASMVNRIAADSFTSEKAMLDEVRALESGGRLAPERAQVLAEIIRSNTERVVQSAIELNDTIGSARKGRDMRALSHSPQQK